MADSIDLDDVTLLGQSVPVGIYITKAIDFEEGTTQNDKPYVVVTFEIIDGEYEGLTVTKRYYFSTFVDKNTGRRGCMGVSAAKTDAHNLGVLSKLPNPFPLDTTKARQALNKAFAGIKIKAVVKMQDGKKTDLDNEGNVKQYRNVALYAVDSPNRGGSTSPSIG